MCGALQAAGYTGKVKIGMDVAASEFLTKDGKYDLDFKTSDNDGSQVLTGWVCFPSLAMPLADRSFPFRPPAAPAAAIRCPVFRMCCHSFEQLKVCHFVSHVHANAR